MTILPKHDIIIRAKIETNTIILTKCNYVTLLVYLYVLRKHASMHVSSQVSQPKELPQLAMLYRI